MRISFTFIDAQQGGGSCTITRSATASFVVSCSPRMGENDEFVGIDGLKTDLTFTIHGAAFVVDLWLEEGTAFAGVKEADTLDSVLILAALQAKMTEAICLSNRSLALPPAPMTCWIISCAFV